MNRRGFLGAILAAGVAPAIVRASSLMVVHNRIVVPEWGPINLYDEAALIGADIERAILYGGVRVFYVPREAREAALHYGAFGSVATFSDA